MTTTIVAQIRPRRDTAANWTANNPTLGIAELGIESDTGRCKVGDGATDWATLKYWFEEEVEENPAGAINGVNNVYTLAHAHRAGTLKVFRNGVRQFSGGVDINVLSSTTFEYVAGPIDAPDTHRVDYKKEAP